MNTQRTASIVRQVLAILVSVYGVLSASVEALHLPVSVSTILVAVAPIMLAIEHYVGDPSTGIPTRPPAAVPGPQVVIPPAPVPELPPQP